MKIMLFTFIVLSLVFSSLSAPTQQASNQRQKRVSDQRLAELETLLALARMKNRKYMSLPVGFGLIDVQKIGRKKRSVLSPFSQFVYPRELPEISLKAEAVPLKGVETALRADDISPFVFPVIEDSLMGWEGREPNVALLQDVGNYV